MLEFDHAKTLVVHYLDAMKVKGGLEITGFKEYDFGWVFYWDSSDYVRTKDINHALGGNVPVLVDRSDGGMYLASGFGPLRFHPDRFRADKQSLLRIE